MNELYDKKISTSSLSGNNAFNFFYTVISVSLATIISFQSLSQNYEEMSSEVQFRMNQNKIDGKEILSGIFIDYEFSFGGINTSADKDNLFRVLSEKFNSTDIYFNPDNGHVRFTSPAKNDLDLLKSSLVEVNIGLNNIFRKEYIVSKY